MEKKTKVGIRLKCMSLAKSCDECDKKAQMTHSIF